VLREIEGDFPAEVQVVGSVPILRPNLVGKYPWYSAGFLVWQDNNNYLRLERARIIFGDNGPVYPNWELRSTANSSARAPTRRPSRRGARRPHKLTRKGNTFAAAYSHGQATTTFLLL
jgi:hypothetical protein